KVKTTDPDDEDHPPAYWVEALRSGSETRIDKARKRLREQGEKALPELRKVAADKDANVRLIVVSLLAELAKQVPDAVPDLATALNDSDPAVRLAAAQGLSRLGDKARVAYFRLLRAGADTSPQVCDAAIDVLRRLGPPDRPALTELGLLLQDKDAAKRAAYAS